MPISRTKASYSRIPQYRPQHHRQASIAKPSQQSNTLPKSTSIQNLSNFEQSEVNDYQEVFYLGLPNRPASNFDNEHGDYVASKGDHIAYRYEVGPLLGKGSYGRVYQCLDHKRK